MAHPVTVKRCQHAVKGVVEFYFSEERLLFRQVRWRHQAMRSAPPYGLDASEVYDPSTRKYFGCSAPSIAIESERCQCIPEVFCVEANNTFTHALQSNEYVVRGWIELPAHNHDVH